MSLPHKEVMVGDGAWWREPEEDCWDTLWNKVRNPSKRGNGHRVLSNYMGMGSKRNVLISLENLG